MGGCGSGRWRLYSKKHLAEYCLELDTDTLTRQQVLQKNTYKVGELRWYQDQKEVFYCLYELDTKDPLHPWLWINYSLSSYNQELEYKLLLATTTPHFGGQRWWFICSLITNGKRCNKRVRKLYLSIRNPYFGCRHCHNLTYYSSQHHDKRVSFYRKNPAALHMLLSQANSEKTTMSKVRMALKVLL